MQCGVSGYSAFVQRYPILPSARTLQKSVQFIKFESGLLYEIFDLLEVFANTCSDEHKDCAIVIDEMSIQEGERFDHSTGKIVGQATFPTHTGRAKKMLVIMLAGIKKRWKIVVGVFFTSKKAEEFQRKKGEKDENHTGKAFAEIIKEVILKTEATTLRVCNMTGDMGPDNLSLWKALGITGGRNGTVIFSFPNPARPGCVIYVIGDAVHLFKAVKAAFENNKVIILPPDIVKQESLPSPIVDYEHIEELYEFEKDNELKVAFRLKPENIHCKQQYSSMNVGTSKAVVCHRTAVGLKLLSEEKQSPNYLTTAWFVELINTFFELVTCRGGPLALSKTNMKSYLEAIELIKKVENLFVHMRIGKRGEWKPCQRGMRILCASLLELQKYFLDERGYIFLLLGRFTQDCIENIFSLVRLRQATPHAVAALQSLKEITLAQYSMAVKGSSYDYEESTPLQGIDILAEARRRAVERAQQRFYGSLDELFANPIDRLSLTEMSSLSTFEEAVIYDMAGSTVVGMQTLSAKFCDNCVNAVKINGGEHHPRAFITEMKEYTMLRGDDGQRELQVYVTDEVFKAILTAELSFRKHRPATVHFKSLDVKNYFVDNLMYVWQGTRIPDCHSICKRILDYFIFARLKEFGRKQSDVIQTERAQKAEVDKASKKMGMKDAAQLITKSSVSKV